MMKLITQENIWEINSRNCPKEYKRRKGEGGREGKREEGRKKGKKGSRKKIKKISDQPS